jgi:pimeloyl-ACP methyl ester carboxylesterase
MHIRPFQIAIPQPALDDLQTRLAQTRWPDEVNDADWGWGTPLAFLQDLVTHWRTGFDWRAQEARLNRLPQFTATVDGHDIHFAHIKGTGPAPFPLMLVHGWPGSFIEFEAIAPLLANPAAHGGRAEDAFDLVIPSLPGFGFSARPAEAMGPKPIGALFTQLMHGLGYSRYGAQGGDWGAAVATAMAQADPARIAGIHLNLIMRLLATPPTEGLSEAERRYLAELATWSDAEGGYSHIQGTRPQTLGYALADSPAGLAAWIAEKFRVWSDCHGDPYTCFTRDQLLANIAIYWFTNTAASSLRIYKSRVLAPPQLAPGERIAPPFGHAQFPREIFRAPREWAERIYNVHHWTVMPKGGHFAAMEQPALLAEDIRTFFRPLR